MSINRQYRIGDLWLTEYPFSVRFGAEVTVPDTTPEALPSFLSDGDLEFTPRRGNATYTLPILVEGPDMASIAESVALLDRECDKQLNTLYVDPGDGLGEPYQYTVFRTTPVYQQDDEVEQAGYRLYEVTWRTLPWPESPTEVTATLTSTTVGTARQQIGTFVAAGSAPSRGSLSVQHETDSLGDVLVYTGPNDGFIPTKLTTVQEEGATALVTDSASISGKRVDIPAGTRALFRMPVSDVPPGEYSVAIRAVAESGVNRVTAWGRHIIDELIKFDGEQGAPYGAEVNASLKDYYALATVHLPTLDGGPAGFVEVAVINFGISAVKVDELYLFNQTGRLSVFYAQQKRLWIDSPSVANEGRGRYLTGNAPDRSDSFTAMNSLPSASLGFPAVHEFVAGTNKVFVTASNVSTKPTVTYAYKPAGMSAIHTGS